MLDIEHRYSDDLEFELYFRESVIIANDFLKSTNEDFEIYSEASDEGKRGAFRNIINKIKSFLAKIRSRISQFWNMLKFSKGKKHLTPEMYLQMDIHEVELDANAREIADSLKRDLVKERKAVQRIHKLVSKLDKTGLPVSDIFDDQAIADALDNARDTVMDKGSAVYNAAAAVAIGNAVSYSVSNRFKLTGELDKLTDEIEKQEYRRQQNNINQSSQENKKLLMCIQKLALKINKNADKGMRLYNKIVNPLDHYKELQSKNQDLHDEKKAKKEAKEAKRLAREARSQARKSRRGGY